MKLVIILPAFNESAVISKVLKTLPKRFKGVSETEVLVVNDGSTDDTFQKVLKTGAGVVNHSINRGLGAAIKTGMEWSRAKKADIVVTFDSDGQHHPSDIKKVIMPIILNKADFVIGSRFKRKQKVPKDRLILNLVANLTTFFLFGVFSTDSQSGLRAFSRKALETINFKADRMEFSSEILLEAKRNKLKTTEVPIKAIYTDYSRTKGQKNLNAIPVFAKVLVRFLR